MSVPSPTSKGRLAWLDLARGLVVLAVVLMHVGIYQYLPLTEGLESRAPLFWTNVSLVLEAVRMPALLVISGWLASSAISKGLFSHKVRHRLLANSYLYVVWLAIYAAITVLLDARDVAQAVAPEQFLGQLLVPYSTLWFLAGLVWYTAFFAATRKLDWRIVLAVSFAISATASLTLSTSLGLWVKIPQLLFFFGLGLYGRSLWKSVASTPWRSLLIGGAVTGVGVAVHDLSGEAAWGYPFSVMASIGGVVTVFSLAALLAASGALWTRPLVWVGRHTVSIYVLHYPALMALTVIPEGPLYEWPRVLLETRAGLWLYPLIFTALIVAASLLVEGLARALRFTWLFELPKTRFVPQLMASWRERKSTRRARKVLSV